MADMQSTQTHPKFTWRFLALGVSTRNVIHITATTEREARDQSPVGCVMVFACRLPVQGVSHA
ncbi:host cell division inhibitor Icd-like protein [Rahnella variigena]|uniref:host cell division inhibitor Icd-like protein n=2 Tax=Rahnella variigena TaxID=574964 RepID=UPI003D298E08